MKLRHLLALPTSAMPRKLGLEASGHASGVLSEKHARATTCTPKLGTRLKTAETERDAAGASREELEQEFSDFYMILYGQPGKGKGKKALVRCQESVAGFVLKPPQDAAQPWGCSHSPLSG